MHRLVSFSCVREHIATALPNVWFSKHFWRITHVYRGIITKRGRSRGVGVSGAATPGRTVEVALRRIFYTRIYVFELKILLDY